MITTNKKWLFFIITLVALGVLIVAVWMFNGRPTQEQTSQNPPTSSVAPAASSTSSTPVANMVRTKTYRNTEWSFEFQYPTDWKIIENPYRSPFSRFNLIIVPKESKYLPDPISVNIVVPDFVDRQFSDLHGNVVQVWGVFGTKYEYTDSGLLEIAIILPFGENKIILGANKKYQNVYDQFLASFKFLK